MKKLLLFCGVAMCVSAVMSPLFSAPQVVPAPKTASSMNYQRPATTDTLIIQRYFLGRNNPFAVDATKDLLRQIVFDTKATTAYFAGYSSSANPYNSGTQLHGEDFRDLSFALTDYALRASEKGNLHDDVTNSSANDAFKTAIDVVALPLSLKPPEKIKVTEDEEVRGTLTYLYTTLPLGAFLKEAERGMKEISGKFSNDALLTVKNRISSIRSTLREYSKKQVALMKKSGFAEAKEETNDTRAYTKLFEEELPILRQQLTLLKGDIDKGFAELQKQQDAKAQTGKATIAQ